MDGIKAIRKIFRHNNSQMQLKTSKLLPDQVHFDLNFIEAGAVTTVEAGEVDMVEAIRRLTTITILVKVAIRIITEWWPLQWH